MKKSGQTNAVMLSESVNEYAVTLNGDIKPSRTLEQRFAVPLQNWVTSNKYKGPNNSANPAYKETQSFTYDASGNLIGLKDEGNHIVSNLYNYNDKYIVASVVNADPILDKPAYSSFETSNNGGWNISGTSSLVSTSAVTGANSLSLGSSNSITASVNAAKPYTLSYWSNNGAMSVANSTLVKTGPVLNGYTYYEYNTVPNNTVSIINTSTKNIDELRLYPQTSRMRTVTYDPLIGKTSECDENNRITYYEYDELGRLGFIKDDAKNIIKMYEYNYAKKQNGCTANFSNSTVSEIFYKNDCGAGYIGLPFTYTIPFGRYTSTVSQDVVDKQVQYDLDMQGQAAANAQSFGIGCIRQYGNIAKSQAFVKNSCPIGYVGTNVTYTVPANRYFSTVNQAVADALAQAEINANGQAFANTSSNTNCSVNTAAQWVSTGVARCEIANGSGTGNYTGNQITQFIDENPNSSTYNLTQWINTGTTNTSACSNASKINIGYNNTTNTTPQVTFTNTLDGLKYYDGIFGSNSSALAGTIPAGVYDISITPSAFSGSYNFSYQVGASAPVNLVGTKVTNININATINFVINGAIYNNTALSQNFTKSNCPSGTSSTVVYTVPEGKYTSTTSLTAANALRDADINANGQAFADNNGVCAIPPPPATVYCSFTPAINWNYITGSISATGATGYFYLVQSTNIDYGSWAYPILIAIINGSCKPSSNKTISFTSNSRIWMVTITPYGEVYVQLISGSPPGTGFTLGIPNSTFNL